MKIGGMGYAILRVTAGQLRELHTIPSYIEFERTVSSMPSAFKNDLTRDLCHDEHPFYFRIKHRFLPRCADRGSLYTFTLGELVRQCADMEALELEHSGKPVPEDPSGVWSHWVNDDAP